MIRFRSFFKTLQKTLQENISFSTLGRTQQSLAQELTTTTMGNVEYHTSSTVPDISPKQCGEDPSCVDDEVRTITNMYGEPLVQFRLFRWNGSKMFGKTGVCYYARKRIADEVAILRKLCPTSKCINLTQNVNFLESNDGFYCEHLPYMLDTVITNRYHFDEIELAHILEGVSSALGYCHSHDVLHRDVAVQNIGFRTCPPIQSSTDIVLFDFDASEVGWRERGELLAKKCIGREDYCPYSFHLYLQEPYLEEHDFESLCYVIIHADEGCLPWDGEEMTSSMLYELKCAKLTKIRDNTSHLLCSFISTRSIKLPKQTTNMNESDSRQTTNYVVAHTVMSH